MTISLYETRTMLAAIRQMYPLRTFLLDTFFKKENVVATKYIDYDLVITKPKLAAFVSPKAKAKVVEKAGYTTKSFRPAYIKEEKILTADDILIREPGNHIYMPGANPVEMAAKKLGESLDELINRIVRREEWMAAQALNAGTIAIVGDGINASVDYEMPATHKIAVGTITAWDNANATPLDDLATWARLIQDDAGLVPDIVIFSNEAYRAFCASSQVASYFDKLRMDFGTIRPQNLPSGANFITKLNYNDLYVDVYSYAGGYMDDSDVMQRYMPSKKVWVGSTQAQCSRNYGAIEDLEFQQYQNGPTQTRFFPKSWQEKDPSIQLLMVQSAPLPVIHQASGFVSAEVLA